jgi:hypothetical protein
LQIGTHISRFVDVLSPASARKAAAQRDSAGGSIDAGGLQSLASLPQHQNLDHVSSEDESTVSQLLLELAGKSIDAPGMSWRCGVTSPQLSNMKLDEMHSAVAAVLGRLQVGHRMPPTAARWGVSPVQVSHNIWIVWTQLLLPAVVCTGQAWHHDGCAAA